VTLGAFSRPARFARASLAVVLALVAGACGYKSGFVLPEGESIGVKVFGNDSKLRDIEMRLHPYLTDSVQRLVSADLVGPARASVWIEGVVLDYVRRGGIRSPDNVQLETGVQIVVLARLVRRVEAPLPDSATNSTDAANAGSGSNSGSNSESISRATSGTTSGARGGAHPGDSPTTLVLREVTVVDERGYLLGDPAGESRAVASVLRNIADRVVLDLMSDLAYEDAPLVELRGTNR
jgi:hypothetical protein